MPQENPLTPAAAGVPAPPKFCLSASRVKARMGSHPSGNFISRLGREATKLRPARWVLIVIALSTGSLSAQELFWNPPSSKTEFESRQIEPENLPYTFKSGDFRLLVTPSLEVDWVDNVNLSRDQPLQDVILRPLVQFDASYPLTSRNLLKFNVGIGYDFYTDHTEFDALRLVSGSQLSFDTYVKDFIINVHDRFQYLQDPAEQAAVASTARFGGLDNTAGVSATWDQQDVLVSAGYDHQNFIASSSTYDYLNRRSELFLGQAGFRFHPKILAGVEAAGSLTAYDQSYLNDNQGYNVGGFVDWRPGEYFHVQARGGYSAFLFDQTSSSLIAENKDSWYGRINATHELSEFFSYSVDAGHELRLGTEADFIVAWYARAGVNWSVLKNVKLTSYLSYEHGDQGQPNQGGHTFETYDWLGLNLGVSHPITDNLTAAIRYRLTLRSSDIADREYTQNLVGVVLTYEIK